MTGQLQGKEAAAGSRGRRSSRAEGRWPPAMQEIGGTTCCAGELRWSDRQREEGDRADCAGRWPLQRGGGRYSRAMAGQGKEKKWPLPEV
ncbi:hypothetical protein AAC387_Pa09g0638 [Persea americana]